MTPATMTSSPSLTINDNPVPVNPDGSFSQGKGLDGAGILPTAFAVLFLSKGKILLAGDPQCLAQGGFHALGRTGPARPARQQRLQRGQTQVLRGRVGQTGRREQMGNEEQHGPSVAKRIR